MSSRSQKLAPAAWDALEEALSTYEWFKDPFEKLVRRLFADAPAILGRLSFGEPKRKVASDLVYALQLREAEYQDLVIGALLALAQHDPAFPRLARLEDGATKVASAQAAMEQVVAATEHHSHLVAERDRLRAEFENREVVAETQRAHSRAIEELHQRFHDMLASKNPQERGKDFEVFLNDLFTLWDMIPRAAYDIDHEQIDGAFTFRTDDYLLEAKWWTERLQPKELNDFKAKIDGKARNTLGLCIAVNGFTPGAIEVHSRSQTPIILMDGTDLYPILEGRIGLDEVLERKRRHAAETGHAMYKVTI